MTTTPAHLHGLLARPGAEALRHSRIREVANAGAGRDDLLAFWFGEPDEVTPGFIRDAAIASLNAGETFYSHNFGIAPLRQAIAEYSTRLHRPESVERVAVTTSGMAAVQLAGQALLTPGDRAVVVTPEWPNVVEVPRIMSAEVETVALTCSASGWTLDLDRLLEALTPETTVLFINSPNNPTGWTMTAEDRDAILERCRKTGTWIVSDDAYERLYYEGNGATPPSFLDAAGPDDRVISANTFSKAWLMTGWRLGWLVAPEPLMPALGKLIEYSTSCAPVFVQRAGIAAITQGEPVVTRTRDRFRRARDFLIRELSRIDGIEAPTPPGAMYSFFRIAGMRDSLQFCKRLVADFGLGLAPGVAFGPEGEGFVRWCFASTEDRLADGVARLRRGLRA
ncbi:MAG: pyridoxal phosphate-dependent aminotransferase [Gemmatimonadetes bacterium]|nr:pyridoxal phosphate-dependent aminotransferase [Gemmatimonadota bacterium]